MAILYEILIGIIAILILFLLYKKNNAPQSKNLGKHNSDYSNNSLDIENKDSPNSRETDNRKRKAATHKTEGEKEYSYDDPDFNLEKIIPTSKMIGKITNQYGDAIYGGNDRYHKDQYLGRLSKGAKIELLDRRVYKNQFELDIIQILVTSNKWEVQEGKIGYVSLDDTSFEKDFDKEKRIIKE